MKVLIVYENIPESTDTFIVEANEAEVADLKLAHGNYVNVSEGEDIEAAMHRISLRLGSEQYATADDCEACNLNVADIAKWNGSNVVGPIDVNEQGIGLVIVTGFYM